MALVCTYICYLSISLFISVVCIPTVVFTIACIVWLFIRKRYLVKDRPNSNSNRNQVNTRLSDSEDRYVPMSKINFLKLRQQTEEINKNENVTKSIHNNSNDIGHTYAPLMMITRVQESKFEKKKEVYYEVMKGRV